MLYYILSLDLTLNSVLNKDLNRISSTLFLHDISIYVKHNTFSIEKSNLNIRNSSYKLKIY